MTDASNWTFVSRSEYRPPGIAVEAVRSLQGALTDARRKISGWLTTDADKNQHLERPRALPPGLVPEIEIDAAASALIERLTADGVTEADNPRTAVVIGPPGSHVAEILSAAARRLEWGEIEPPERLDLLSSESASHDSVATLASSVKSPRVVPRFERWFVRREPGMAAIRGAVEALARPPGIRLVGCDSWTWALLERAIGIETTLDEPLALAPFDAGKLDSWLGQGFRAGPQVCMKAGSREEVFAVPSNGESKASTRPHSALTRLASATRGNPGIALELWKRALREGDLRGDKNKTTPQERELSWWTVPPEDAEIELPGEVDVLDRLVLHGSLVHGGLSLELLCSGLPFPKHGIVRRTSKFESRGVLFKNEAGDLVVSEAAYLDVRRHLATRGFLVDDF